MLAGAHYMQHSHNMAQYCRVLAHRLVRDMRDKQKWLPIMQLLMAYAMNPSEDLQPFWDQAHDMDGLGFLHA